MLGVPVSPVAVPVKGPLKPVAVTVPVIPISSWNVEAPETFTPPAATVMPPVLT